MVHLALLVERVIVGGLLAGHGAQKLFGAFGGPGVEGTSGWFESMRLRPGRNWALLAGWSEFGGGILTALGLLNPVGPLMAIGAMTMAWLKVHLGKPIWNSEGGAELPLTNMALLGSLVVAGPGRLSLDALLRRRQPRWLALAGLAVIALGVSIARRQEQEATEAEAALSSEPAPSGLAPGPAADTAAERTPAMQPERRVEVGI